MLAKNYKRILSLFLMINLIFNLPPDSQSFASDAWDDELVPGVDYVKNQILVVYGKKDDRGSVTNTIKKENAIITAEKKLNWGDNLMLIDLPEGESVKDAIENVSKDDDVIYAQPNYIYKPTATAGSLVDDPAATFHDENTPYQYYLDQIKVGDAWEKIDSIPHSKTKVAVIDTGADVNNEDLKNVINRKDSVKIDEYGNITKLERDSTVHGTHVTGTIVAESNNGTGVAGVASGKHNDIVDMIAIDASNKTGGGFTIFAVINAMQYAKDKGARIINLSLGGPYQYWDYLYDSTISDFYDEDVICICSAGNDGREINHYPANASRAIGVIALDKTGEERSMYSNYGMRENKLSAPGEYIYNTWPAPENYWYSSGTSMAAPIVSGVAAMALSVNPDLTAGELKALLYDTCDDLKEPGYDADTGYGRVNAYRAVQAANGEMPLVKFLKIDDSVAKYQFVENGSSAVAPELEEIRGFTFEGWNTDFSNVQNNLTVKPVYKENKYNIRLHSNYKGGQIKTLEDILYTRNIKLGNQINSGCTFKGWNTKANGTGVDYDGKSDYYGLTSENNKTVDLYAQWSVNKVEHLRVSSTTVNSVKLMWDKKVGVTGYIIYIYRGNKIIAKKTISCRSSYVISSLSAGRAYKFYIQGYLKLSNGSIVKSVKKTEIPAITSPVKVKLVKITTKSKNVTVTWRKETCSKYEVQIALNTKFKKGLKKYMTKNANTIKTTFKKLNKGRKYYVRVRALTISGKLKKYGAWSIVKSIKCKT